jgi:hypothetical protein
MAKYIRFVVEKIDPITGREQGLFKSAYALLRGTEILLHDHERLDELMVWFDKNLKVPTRFNRSKSKGYMRRKTTGMSWFKSEA